MVVLMDTVVYDGWSYHFVGERILFHDESFDKYPFENFDDCTVQDNALTGNNGDLSRVYTPLQLIALVFTNNPSHHLSYPLSYGSRWSCANVKLVN